MKKFHFLYESLDCDLATQVINRFVLIFAFMGFALLRLEATPSLSRVNPPQVDVGQWALLVLPHEMPVHTCGLILEVNSEHSSRPQRGGFFHMKERGYGLISNLEGELSESSLLAANNDMGSFVFLKQDIGCFPSVVREFLPLNQISVSVSALMGIEIKACQAHTSLELIMSPSEFGSKDLLLDGSMKRPLRSLITTYRVC